MLKFYVDAASAIPAAMNRLLREGAVAAGRPRAHAPFWPTVLYVELRRRVESAVYEGRVTVEVRSLPYESAFLVTEECPDKVLEQQLWRGVEACLVRARKWDAP